MNLNSVIIGTSDVDKLGKFYEQVIGRKSDMHDEGWYGWQFGDINFTIGEHSEVGGKSKEPQRIIFNFETSDVKEEFERIKNIEGAEIVKEPYTMEGWDGSLIATFADPDGNYFQLMTPWESN